MVLFGFTPFGGFGWPLRIVFWLVTVFVGLFLARFLVAVSREIRKDQAGTSATDHLVEAGSRTGRWMIVLIAGIAGVFVSGLASFGEVLDMVTQMIGQHPFAFSNVGIAGIGAAVTSGLADLSTSQYVGLVLVLIGGVMLVTEVRT